MHINGEHEDLAIVLARINLEGPCSQGAGETVNNGELGRDLSGNSGDLLRDVLRGAAARA